MMLTWTKKKKVESEKVRKVAILCIILKLKPTVLERDGDWLWAIRDDVKSLVQEYGRIIWIVIP